MICSTSPSVLAWLSLPFGVLLLSLSLLPSLLPNFWEKWHGLWVGILSLLFTGSFLSILGKEALYPICHTLFLDYIPFALLISALYITACHIVIRVQGVPSPRANVTLLLLGMLTAIFMGTTGACAIWIHPLLNLNKNRTHRHHTVIFFIFCVANVAGSVSSLGDPPLLLGFLKGVPFFWPTYALWPAWLAVSSALLGTYYIFDRWYWKKDALVHEKPGALRFKVQDGRYFIYLLVLIGMVVFLSCQEWGAAHLTFGAQKDLCLKWPVAWIARDTLLAVSIFLIWIFGPKTSRQYNAFRWSVIQELCLVFVSLFLCVIPIDLLLKGGHVPWLKNSLTTPFSYFWTSGMISSVLDNAPTYLLCVEAAGGFQQIPPLILKAISCGSVFMGALTYLGNAPNLLVRAIALQANVPMPSFMAYMKWSYGILLPIFLIFSYLFFA